MHQKKVALVTGGCRGIGLGIAHCLAKEGIDLALCGTRDPSKVEDVIDDVKHHGTDVFYVQADIAMEKSRQDLVERIRERFGQINFLINNAGVAPEQRADILEATEESFDRVIGINLKGPYFLTQQIARWMIEQRETDKTYTGCVVNISSISADIVSINRGEYCLSKAGIGMATKLWAVRLGEFDIPVYEIRPGIIQTDMTAPAQAKYDRLINDGLLLQSRWGFPEDVGKVVAALVRGDLAYSTGQVIYVDGGLTTQRL